MNVLGRVRLKLVDRDCTEFAAIGTTAGGTGDGTTAGGVEMHCTEFAAIGTTAGGTGDGTTAGGTRDAVTSSERNPAVCTVVPVAFAGEDTAAASTGDELVADNGTTDASTEEALASAGCFPVKGKVVPTESEDATADDAFPAIAIDEPV